MGFDPTKTPAKYKDLEERWDWVVSFMILEDKFVHEVLMMMEKRQTNTVPTMAVGVEDVRLILWYNIDFVNKLTDPEMRFIVTHEIYHIVLHHITSRLPLNPDDRKLYNTAADLAINCLIPHSVNRHMSTKDELKGCLPRDFGFPEKLSMEQYVQLLRDDKSGKSGGNGKGNGKDGGFDDHSKWAESEIIDEIIRNKVEVLSKNEKVWGSLAGDLQAMILAAQRSQVNWAKYLRQYLGNLVSARSIPTMKRPNRRFGYPYCGTKRLHTDRKLVAIDTSGSIGDNDISQFLAEINKLAEIQPVDLIMFDHELQGNIIPFNRKATRFNVKGRGGTSFEPVMKLAAERHYQSLIMLTDGCAEATEEPRGVRDVLWVITGKDNKPPVEWGKIVYITPKE